MPNFRRFYIGYLTSLLGTAMSSLATAFAVLDGGASVADLGYVFAAGIVPQVIFMAAGGVVADRMGRRRVMLAADLARACSQGTLAAALLLTQPPVWAFVLLAVVRGAGDGFFTPALTGLTVQIAPAGELGNANAMLGIARSATVIAGPVLAGTLIAAAGPAVVIAADAVSYGASVLALALLRFPTATSSPRPAERGSGRLSGAVTARRPFLADLTEGWAQFRSIRWLMVTAAHFALFNLFVWGPFLLLGPVLARAYLGGAGAWGAVMACYGAGSVLGGVLVLGRRPRRPVAAATIASFGFALPCALLALRAPVAGVAAGTLAAGAGSAVNGALGMTALQQHVPRRALARVSGLEIVIAFAFGPLAFAAAGPVAAVVGARTVLGFGAIWGTVSSATVLALPCVRAVTWREAPQRPPGSRPG